MRRKLVIGAGLSMVAAAIAAALLLGRPPFLRALLPGADSHDAQHVKPQSEAEGESAWQGTQPFLMVRRMQVAQDSINAGDRAAVQLQDQMIQDVGKAISSAPASLWRDDRNQTALVLYLLNGGPPQPVRRLLNQRIELGKLEKPMIALLAFSERRQNAGELLAGIDPMALPRTAGAVLAMAKGMSLQSDPAKARGQFRIAQLLAPGTVIDEGALRREISLLVAEKNGPEAVSRAARYIWRFGRSVYSEHLTNRFSGEVLPELASKGTAIEPMKRYFNEIPTPARRALLLSMTRDSVLAGHLDRIAFLSGEARQIENATPDEDNRVTMYEAISRSLVNDPVGGADALISVDRSLLSPKDLGLLDATLALVKSVRQPPVPSADVIDAKEGSTPVIFAAQDAVARADEALLEMKQ